MGDEARKAVVRLRKIGAGKSPSLQELDETRGPFQARLRRILSNLPEGEVLERKYSMPSLGRDIGLEHSALPSKEIIEAKYLATGIEKFEAEGRASPRVFRWEEGIDEDSPGDRAAQEAAAREFEAG